MGLFNFCMHAIVERCPEENTDFHVKHEDFPLATAPVTKTWQICGEKCANENSCTHWTWLKQSHSRESFRGKCLFKPERGNVRSSEGAISGSKKCPGSPGRSDIQIHNVGFLFIFIL